MNNNRNEKENANPVVYSVQQNNSNSTLLNSIGYTDCWLAFDIYNNNNNNINNVNNNNNNNYNHYSSRTLQSVSTTATTTEELISAKELPTGIRSSLSSPLSSSSSSLLFLQSQPKVITLEEYATKRAFEYVTNLVGDDNNNGGGDGVMNGVSILSKLGFVNHNNNLENSKSKGSNKRSNRLDDVVLFREKRFSKSSSYTIPKINGKKIQKHNMSTTTLPTTVTLLPNTNTNTATTTTTTTVQRLIKQNNYLDPITANEIFDIIRTIQDPEHPLTLEELGVIRRSQITIYDNNNNDNDNDNNDVSNNVKINKDQKEYEKVTQAFCSVRFTPTIPHCSMATLIGLCIRVKLLRSVPSRFKVTVTIEPGTHNNEHAINKQLADKERVCAALDNQHLRNVVNKCIRANPVS